MKCKDCWIWLIIALALQSSETPAGVVLSPEAGLSRTIIYGSTENGTGPPGILDTFYSSNLNGELLGSHDGRIADGIDIDSLLSYKLDVLHRVAPLDATLSIPLEQVLRNFDPTFDDYADVFITVLGTSRHVFDSLSFASAPIFSSGFSVSTGDFSGKLVMSLDMKVAIQRLIDRGYDRALILFQTFDSTTSGPSLVTFANSPTLSFASLDPSVQPVPEAPSIVHVGLAGLGVILLGLTRRF